MSIELQCYITVLFPCSMRVIWHVLQKSLSPETDDGTGCTGQDGRTVRRSKRRRTETAASIASKAQQLLQCQFCSFVAEDKIMLYSHYQFHQQMMSNQQQIRNKRTYFVHNLTSHRNNYYHYVPLEWKGASPQLCRAVAAPLLFYVNDSSF